MGNSTEPQHQQINGRSPPEAIEAAVGQGASR